MNPQAKGWTPERRARMAQQIKNWQPWQHSTGAKTAEGKARSSQNANKGKGALMAQIKELRRELMAEIDESNAVIMTAQNLSRK